MEMIAIAVISLLMTVITLGYSLWTIWRIFFGPLPEHLKEVKEAPLIMTISPLVLAVASLILGIFPGLVTDFIARALGG
jgi:NADH-quinone oxidoreductase subunit M